MKKTSDRLDDLNRSGGYYLKEVSLNGPLNKQPNTRFDSPLKEKLKPNPTHQARKEFSDSNKKTGSLSQISSHRAQGLSKNLEINLDKLKKMFPFAYQQEPRLKKQVSDPTSLPVIPKSSFQAEKDRLFKSTFSHVPAHQSQRLSTPKINIVPKNKRLSSLNTKEYDNFCTQAGVIGSKRKTNQDHPILKFDLPHNVNLIGVCDGHGINGHLVSSFITHKLISSLNEALQNTKEPVNIRDIGEKVYAETNNQLIKASGINVTLSGSTVVTVIGHNKKLHCFNVGDSRIILVSNVNGKWVCKPLSDDQKPCRKDQKERVCKFGGRVEAQKDENNRPVGPMRVWMAKQQIPGLAMTRAFGDTIGVKAGVIGTPQILQLDVKPSDCFIAAASDGIWQYMTNQDVMNIMIPYYQKGNLKAGCEDVVKKSIALWKKYCMSRDDITIVASDISRLCPV